MASNEAWQIRILYPTGWRDVTPFVDTIVTPISAVIGATAETEGDPAGMSFVLNNSDLRFTPDNPVAYGGLSWALDGGMEVSCVESVGPWVMPDFHGFISFPEIDSWAKSSAAAPRDQQITVTVIDLLGEFNDDDVMVSTLAEHIRFEGGSALIGCWPMGDATQPFPDMIGNAPDAVMTLATAPAFATTTVTGNPAFLPQSGGTLPGDDLPVCRLEASTALFAGTTVNNLLAPVIDVDFVDPITFAVPSYAVLTGKTLTSVCWYWPDMPAGGPAGGPCSLLTLQTTNVTLVVTVDSTGQIRIDSLGLLTGTLTPAINLPNQAWISIGIRYNHAAPSLKFWVNGTEYNVVLAGTLASDKLESIGTSQYYSGSIGYLQAYVGAATDWALADYLDQRTVALNGWANQHTGDRIKMLAQYAGQSLGLLDRVDTGVSLMNKAAFAGQGFAAAMANAETTEQGTLIVNRSGRLDFADRQRRYLI